MRSRGASHHRATGRLQAEYLRAHADLASRGTLNAGRTAAADANVADQLRDVRASVVAALERDRQLPATDAQIALLDGYLGASEIAAAAGRTEAGPFDGEGGTEDSLDARRRRMAEAAAARLEGHAQTEGDAEQPRPPES